MSSEQQSVNQKATQVMSDLFGYDNGLNVASAYSGARDDFLMALEDAVEAVLEPRSGFADLTDDIAGVMGAPIPSGRALEADIEEIALRMGALSSQRFLVGSLIEEFLLVSPVPQNLLTLKNRNSWELGGAAFVFLHGAIVAANDEDHGIIFNDVLAEGVLGKGEAAGLRDAIAAQDPEALKMVLGGLNIAGQVNFTAAFLVVSGFIATIYKSWGDEEAQFAAVGGGYLKMKGYADLWEVLQEELKLAYMKSVSAFSMAQVTDGAMTNQGALADSYIEVGKPIKLPYTSPSFLIDNFGTLTSEFTPAPSPQQETQAYYTSPWADPARIMLINFGALTLGGVLAGGR
jgi:hypothetical protein